MNYSNMMKIQAKAVQSGQFRQVAGMIETFLESGDKLSKDFAYLAIDPWTGKQLESLVKNIDTTSFCALFSSMKSTSCGRHLRTYKELYYQKD